MTIHEFKNAIDGFEKLRKEQQQEYLFGVRKICFWTIRAMVGKKGPKETDIFHLEIDELIQKARLKQRVMTTKPMQKIVIPNDQ
jgi:hypothetical protein